MTNLCMLCAVRNSEFGDIHLLMISTSLRNLKSPLGVQFLILFTSIYRVFRSVPMYTMEKHPQSMRLASLKLLGVSMMIRMLNHNAPVLGFMTVFRSFWFCCTNILCTTLGSNFLGGAVFVIFSGFVN